MRTRQNVLEYDVTLSEKSLALAYRSYFVTQFFNGPPRQHSQIKVRYTL
jgi:hypothetical protein